MNNPDLYALLHALWADLQDVRVLWQLAVIGSGIAVAAWVNRLIWPRLTATDETLKFTLGGLQRVQFPLTALAIVLIGRAVLERWQSVNLLNVAVPLLTALAIVRVAVYALRRVFAPSGWVRASERFIAWAVWIGFALYITGLAPGLINFLDGVGFSVGKDRITALLMLQAALTVGITLLAALWLGRAIESRFMRARTLDVNLRVMFSKVTRALLVLVAVLIALPAVGIDLTVLSVFGGALGVGIGLGLQKIAANYVSGFIILMDRSVGIGDQVTIDRCTGELTKMTARYVVVRNPDGTDLDLAARAMEEAARRQPRVLREPAPAVLVKQFGESGIDLELGVWIEDPQDGHAGLRSDLYRAIWREFQAQGIEIPYPRREVRVLGDARSGPRQS